MTGAATAIPGDSNVNGLGLVSRSEDLELASNHSAH